MIFTKHFRKYYLKYGYLLLIGILVLLVVDYFQLIIPEITRDILGIYRVADEKITSGLIVTENDLLSQIIPHLQKMLIILLIVSFGRFLWRLFIFGTSRKIEEDLRNEMFEHGTKLSNTFYSKEKVGGLMTYFINDLGAVRMAFGPGLMMIVDGIFLGGLTLYKMFKIDVMLTVYAFIPMIALAILMFFLRKSMQHRFKERQQSFEDMSDYVQENISGIAVIKAYVKEAASALRFEYRTKDFFDKNIAFVRQRLVFQIAITISINAVIFTLIGYGGYLAIHGQLLTEQLVEYLSFFSILTWPVMALVRVLTISSQASASAQRISTFLDAEIEINDDLAVETPELEGSIVAKKLSFSYPDDPDTLILDNVSFEIKNGEMIGILGRTGSGKSTLVDLLLRVYNVDLNTLFIDSRDIMTIPLKQLRGSVGYVPQDNFLFSDTIKANIGFSQVELDFEKVVTAAKLSDVYTNIVEFKEGFDTVLGERGVTVSGGQKQRISIARALTKDPKILILDDSVSAVDTKTEEAIIKNLSQVRKNKTTILIAHRISTVRHMDKIILLDKGKLVGIGNHDELLKESPLYQEMVRLQTLDKLEEEGGEANV
ncbi:MAG: ABC transporter ATP-binding protein [Acholeplasmataceae bacterium]|jgi:ATP-binding cassette subfamily B protein